MIDALVRLGDRLHRAEDTRAAARGWTITRTGWADLGRVYRDTRWDTRAPALPVTETEPLWASTAAQYSTASAPAAAIWRGISA